MISAFSVNARIPQVDLSHTRGTAGWLSETTTTATTVSLGNLSTILEDGCIQHDHPREQQPEGAEETKEEEGIDEQLLEDMEEVLKDHPSLCEPPETIPVGFTATRNLLGFGDPSSAPATRDDQNDIVPLQDESADESLSMVTPPLSRPSLHSYLDEEFFRLVEEQEEDHSGDDSDESSFPDKVTPSSSSAKTAPSAIGDDESSLVLLQDDTHSTTNPKQSNLSSKNDAHAPPVVWVITPGYDGTGSVRFKFTTDGGACLLLKQEEALVSVDIIKKSISNSVFQLYSLEGGTSRLLSPSTITAEMEALLLTQSRSHTATTDVDSSPCVTPETRSSNHGSKRPGQRLVRYFMRRRWKKAVHRQIQIALGDLEMKRKRMWMVLHPVFVLWRLLKGRSYRRNTM